MWRWSLVAIATSCGSEGAAVVDASSPDTSPLTYPDPLAGTTKVATLVKGGFTFTEGPVWISGSLIFSDENGGDTIWKVDSAGVFSVFRTPSNNANGNAVDPMARLVTCEQATHRVTLTGGAVAPVASTYMGKSFNSPNDVIVRSDGNVYFTDPDYAANATDRQPFQGVFRVDTSHVVSVVASDMSKPNGIAFSPDEAWLYVDDTTTSHVRMFPVVADGATGSPLDFVTTSGSLADGMAMDDAGNLYVATTEGIEVVRPDASSIGVIRVPEQPANCTFGGPDRKTLYITARTGLYSIVLNVPGKP